MVTIKTVAQKCGCSVATVSKAMNGATDISVETAARIRAVANEMGYMPNAAARALKTTRSHSFGVLFEDDTNNGLTHEYFSHILESFKRKAELLGYDISFITSRQGSRNLRYAEHARYRNYDGVVVASVDYLDPSVIELAASGIPVVTIDYAFDGCGCVMSDNVSGMAQLVQYIHAQGHRKIAFIHGELTAVTRSRIASFCRTCGELGIQVPDEYLLQGKFHDTQTSAELTERLLKLPDPPTCILYPDDFSYIGGRNYLESIGKRIPEDISVAGYDGIRLSEMLRPRLTTLQQDAALIGRSAAEELSRAVTEGRSYIPNTIVIPGRLLPGETIKKIDPESR